MKDQNYSGRAAEAAARAKANRSQRPMKTIAEIQLESARKEIVRRSRCIALLSQTLNDILPQIGKLVLQDYAAMNEGLILAEQILRADEHAD